MTLKITNSRYPSFRQQFYTAGDEQQIREVLEPYGLWTPTVAHQIRYVFHLLRRGVVVYIKDSKIEVFLPFTKHAYTNNYAHLIQHDPNEFKTFSELFAYVDTHTQKKDQSKDIILPQCAWVVNGGLVRYDARSVELDTGLDVVYGHIQKACDSGLVTNNTVFILNTRDFPLVHAKNFHPYVEMYGNVELPVSLHPNQVPVLSMTSSNVHLDVPIPTWEETPASVHVTNPIPFSERIPKAVFRGTSTGLNTNSRNARLRILELAKQFPTHLDAGITKWNFRARKCSSDKYLRILPVKWKRTFKTKPFLTYEQQAEFQMIVNVPGHTSAFRLPTLMLLGSVILHVDRTPYKAWFEKYLRPWTHYIPILPDLSNLIDTIEWCRTHTKMCMYIVEQAREFAEKAISGSLSNDYMVGVLNGLPPCTDLVFPESPFRSLAGMYVESVFNSTRERERAKQWRNNPTVMFYGPNVFKLIEKSEDINELWVYKDVISTIEEHTHVPRNRAYFRKILGVYHDKQASQRFLVLERLQGQSLLQYIQKDKPAVSRVMEMVLDVLELLEHGYAHAQFVHGDLTPWNLIVGDRPRAVGVIDFGKSYTSANTNDHKRDTIVLIVHVLFLCMTNRLENYEKIPAILSTCIFRHWQFRDVSESCNTLGHIRRFDSIQTLDLDMHTYDLSNIHLGLNKLAQISS